MPEHRPSATLRALVVRGAVWLALTAWAGALFASLVAPHDADAASPRTHPSPRAPPPTKVATVQDAGTSGGQGPIAATSRGVPSATPAVPNDAGVVEAKTLDGGTRAFTFSELDIEGRLKSPQLVYFLRRVRAEFSAEGLGHRSFLLEMSETRKESTF